MQVDSLSLFGWHCQAAMYWLNVGDLKLIRTPTRRNEPLRIDLTANQCLVFSRQLQNQAVWWWWASFYRNSVSRTVFYDFPRPAAMRELAGDVATFEARITSEQVDLVGMKGCSVLFQMSIEITQNAQEKSTLLGEEKTFSLFFTTHAILYSCTFDIFWLSGTFKWFLTTSCISLTLSSVVLSPSPSEKTCSLSADCSSYRVYSVCPCVWKTSPITFDRPLVLSQKLKKETAVYAATFSVSSKITPNPTARAVIVSINRCECWIITTFF